MNTSKEKLRRITDFIVEKKAINPIAFDLRNYSNLYDYFIICSGDSTTQVNAIFQEVKKKSKSENFTIHHYEKDEFSNWILVDFFDIALHIFINSAREFYNLENLWAKAKKIKLFEQKKSKKNSKKG